MEIVNNFFSYLFNLVDDLEINKNIRDQSKSKAYPIIRTRVSLLFSITQQLNC